MLPEIIQPHPAVVANGLTGNFGKFQIGEVIIKRLALPQAQAPWIYSSPNTERFFINDYIRTAMLVFVTGV